MSLSLQTQGFHRWKVFIICYIFLELSPIKLYDTGARSIIAAISSRRFVSKLTVAHNRLGADGFGELFRFLCSNEGRKYAIDEIDLHNCGIDEISLMALSEYVRGSRSLRTLQLQQVNTLLLCPSSCVLTRSCN